MKKIVPQINKIIPFLTATCLLTINLLTSTSHGFLPVCKDKKETMEYNERQILLWRDELENKFKARAFVRGKLVKVIEQRRGHIHLEIDFDGEPVTTNDHIEIIYNTQFGPLPEMQTGDEVIACGDFILDQTSEFNGIIHWVHQALGSRHEDGYVAINGIINRN